MPWEVLRAAVDVLLRSERREVELHFTGGEPLLEFDLLRRAVEHAETTRPPGKTLGFALSTNGTLLDGRRTAFLAGHRIRTQLSFDGVPAAQDLRGRGTFARLDGCLDLVRREQPAFFERDLAVALTLTARSLPVLAQSVDYFLEKRVRRLRLAPSVTRDPDWQPASEAELDRQLGRVFKASLLLYRRTGQVPVTLFQKTGRREPRRSWLAACAAATGEVLTVDVDGQVSGCVRLAPSLRVPDASLGASAELGSLLDPAFASRLDRWSRLGPRAALFRPSRRRHSAWGPCRRCTRRHDCFVCPLPADLEASAGDRDRVPDLVCAFHRISQRYRNRFPRQPAPLELQARGQPLPELLRELLRFAES